MARTTWDVDVEGQSHTIVLEWTYFGGDREFSIDVNLMDDNQPPMCWSSEQPFAIDGHQGRVATRPQKINIAAFDIEPYSRRAADPTGQRQALTARGTRVPRAALIAYPDPPEHHDPRRTHTN